MSGKIILLILISIVIFFGLISGCAFALPAQFSRSPLANRGEGQSYSFGGDFGVNPMTRAQSFSTQLLSLSGRNGLDLSIGLSFQNNFWQTVDKSVTAFNSRTPMSVSEEQLDKLGWGDWHEFSRPKFSSDNYFYPEKVSSMFPENNLGGWSLQSPASGRAYHAAFIESYVGTDKIPRYRCNSGYFMIVGADGGTSFFYPDAAKFTQLYGSTYSLRMVSEDCYSLDDETKYTNYVEALKSLEFYSANNDGKKLVISGQKNIELAGESHPTIVVRVFDTQGNYKEYEIITSNFAHEGRTSVIGEGLAVKSGDRFGNYISMEYNLERPKSWAEFKMNSAKIMDTVGREVDITYDPDYQFPKSVTAKKFYPDGSDMTISLEFKEMFFDNSEMQTELQKLQPIMQFVYDINKAQMPTQTQKKSQLYYDLNRFATISKINLPGSLNWQFDYDLGWGLTSNIDISGTPLMMSDGTITQVTNPYGKITKYFADRYRKGIIKDRLNKLQDLTQFLSPGITDYSPVVRYGYINKVESYDSGKLESTITYDTNIIDPIYDGPNGNATATVTYSDGAGKTLKIEKHVYENQEDRDFTEKESSVISPEGNVLQKTQNEYNCIKIGAVYMGGKKEGFCLLSSKTVMQDGASTTTRFDYSGIRSLKNPVGADLGSFVFYRQKEVTIEDENGAVKTDRASYADDQKYLDANLISLPKTQMTLDGNGALWASSEVQYDTETAEKVDRSQYENADGPTNILGLATKQIRYDPTGKLGPIITKTIYNELGLPIGAFNGRGFSTKVEYDPAAGCGAYITRTINALQQDSKITYDCRDGQALSVTDANGLLTKLEYNDPLRRITKMTNPDGTYETISYDDIANTVTESFFDLNGILFSELTTYSDGDGRQIRTESINPNGIGGEKISIGKGYDALGRASKETNEYGYSTLMGYDALSRPIKITNPNGEYSTLEYRGRTVISKDLHGRIKEEEKDALGRLVRVKTEDGIEMHYIYDLLGNLISATTGSGQERSFTYDGFGRKMSEKIPEKSGIYSVVGYDRNGNPTKIINAGGYTISTTYDALDRPLSTTYSGPVQTSPVAYIYDDGAMAIGKLSSVIDGDASRTFEYDLQGRLAKEKLNLENYQFEIGYEYNSLNKLKSMTMPSGRTISYEYNDAGNLKSVDGKTNGVNKEFLFIEEYAKHGPAVKQTLGNKLTMEMNYDSKTLMLSSKRTGPLNFKYDYNTAPVKCDGSGSYLQAEGSDIGSVYEQLPSGSRTITYTYDCLDRLKEAQADGAQGWDLKYEFDKNYNRIKQFGAAEIEQNLKFDSSNHISGYKYDSDGNVIDDGINTYTYDGAGRLVSATTSNGTWNYVYLGGDRVISKSGDSENYFIRNANGQLLSEFEKSDKTEKKDKIEYYHTDNLGSIRLITDENGNAISSRDFYPYGEEQTKSADSTTKKFTGQERDSETNNDYMKARYYASTSGIFLSTDAAAPNLENPQTWNRYVYANNNPVNLVDTSGNEGQRVSSITIDAWQSAWRDFSEIESMISYLKSNNIKNVNLNPGTQMKADYQSTAYNNLKKITDKMSANGIRVNYLYAELNYPIGNYADFLKNYPDLGINTIVDDSEFTDLHLSKFKQNLQSVKSRGLGYSAYVSVEGVGNSGVSESTKRWALQNLDETILMSYLSCDVNSQRAILDPLLSYADAQGKRGAVKIAILMGGKSVGNEKSCERMLSESYFQTFIKDLDAWAQTHPSYGGILLETNKMLPGYNIY